MHQALRKDAKRATLKHEIWDFFLTKGPAPAHLVVWAAQAVSQLRAVHFLQTTRILPCLIWMSTKGDFNSHEGVVSTMARLTLYLHVRWDCQHCPVSCWGLAHENANAGCGGASLVQIWGAAPWQVSRSRDSPPAKISSGLQQLQLWPQE